MMFIITLGVLLVPVVAFAAWRAGVKAWEIAMLLFAGIVIVFAVLFVIYLGGFNQ